MTNNRRVVVCRDREALARAVATRFLTTVRDALDGDDPAHVVLTGGSMGAAVQIAIRELPTRDSIDWTRVHFWWGDERWVTRADPDRNDIQARAALLDHIDVPSENIHAFPARGDGENLDEAAAAYSALLASHATAGGNLPRFDVTFLGVGPDGHVASLFPDLPEIESRASGVLAVRHSPKPPPDRLTLSLAAINSSERVWLVVAGDDKAKALEGALLRANLNEVPAARVEGRTQTVFFADQDASAHVPDALITPTR